MSYVKNSTSVNLNHLKMLSRYCIPPKVCCETASPKNIFAKLHTPKMMSRDWTPQMMWQDCTPQKWCHETAPPPPKMMFARLHPPKMMSWDCIPPKWCCETAPPQMMLRDCTPPNFCDYFLNIRQLFQILVEWLPWVILQNLQHVLLSGYCGIPTKMWKVNGFPRNCSRRYIFRIP